MTKEELRKKHGTPKEFEDAIWRACNDLFITDSEAIDAIKKYEKEWESAKD